MDDDEDEEEDEEEEVEEAMVLPLVAAPVVVLEGLGGGGGGPCWATVTTAAGPGGGISTAAFMCPVNCPGSGRVGSWGSGEDRVPWVSPTPSVFLHATIAMSTVSQKFAQLRNFTL